MSEELKPCPFCGNPVEHESTITEEVIRCSMCPAKMVYDGSYAALFAMWNTRRPPAIDRDAGEIATVLDECAPILTHGFARFKAEAMDRIAALSRPVDSMEMVVDTYDEYVALLQDELHDVVLLAHSHGWRSTRYDAGAELREKITLLKAALSDSTPTEPKE